MCGDNNCILVSALSLWVTVQDVGRNDSLLLRLVFIFLVSSLPLKQFKQNKPRLAAVDISKKMMFQKSSKRPNNIIIFLDLYLKLLVRHRIM